MLATWYDGREFASCTKGNTAVPCYRMWSRKSTDNGATWAADEALSDVASPLPGQPDTTVQSTYAGDYDYGSATASKHYTSWTDGRVAISGQSQQDAFTDSEAAGGGGGGDITLTAQAQSKDAKSKVTLNWDPADGGNMNVLRDGVIVQTTADDGSTQEKFKRANGMSFTYQVCETDSGDCSNEVQVTIP